MESNSDKSKKGSVKKKIEKSQFLDKISFARHPKSLVELKDLEHFLIINQKLNKLIKKENPLKNNEQERTM